MHLPPRCDADLEAVDETNRLIKKAFACGLQHLLGRHGTPDAKFAFLMAELDVLHARSCKERALVDSQLRRAQSWAGRFKCPNIRRDRDRMLAVQQEHFGPVVRALHLLLCRRGLPSQISLGLLAPPCAGAR